MIAFRTPWRLWRISVYTHNIAFVTNGNFFRRSAWRAVNPSWINVRQCWYNTFLLDWEGFGRILIVDVEAIVRAWATLFHNICSWAIFLFVVSLQNFFFYFSRWSKLHSSDLTMMLRCFWDVCYIRLGMHLTITMNKRSNTTISTINEASYPFSIIPGWSRVRMSFFESCEIIILIFIGLLPNLTEIF